LKGADGVVGTQVRPACRLALAVLKIVAIGGTSGRQRKQDFAGIGKVAGWWGHQPGREAGHQPGREALMG